MVYLLQLTYDEIVDILDVKYISGSARGYTIPPGLYNVSDINSVIKSIHPDKVKVNFTIDEIKLKSNLATKKAIKFAKKSFFSTF